MKKPLQKFDLELPADADYKMQYIHERDKANYESLEKWVYLGADIRNPSYAKIGITMGDMRSRSYSSANPGFYLFCAFQCQESTTESQLREIEISALSYLDCMFTHNNGLTKRVRHYESGRMSECYYDIEFTDFLQCLHTFLFNYHARHFSIGDFNGEGDYLNWYFTPTKTWEEQVKFLRMIIQ